MTAVTEIGILIQSLPIPAIIGQFYIVHYPPSRPRGLANHFLSTLCTASHLHTCSDSRSLTSQRVRCPVHCITIKDFRPATLCRSHSMHHSDSLFFPNVATVGLPKQQKPVTEVPAPCH